jgi:hypothetical protein
MDPPTMEDLPFTPVQQAARFTPIEWAHLAGETFVAFVLKGA